MEKKQRVYQPGETIMQEGEESSYFLLLEKGIVEVYIRGRKVNTIDAGKSQDFIGEIGVILGTPRTATIVAATETTARYFPKLQLETLIKASPSIAVRLVLSLCRKMVNSTSIVPEYEHLPPSVLESGSTERSLRNYMRGLLYLIEKGADDPTGLAAKELLFYFLETNPWRIQSSDPRLILPSGDLEEAEREP